jgi:hypothetical protein
VPCRGTGAPRSSLLEFGASPEPCCVASARSPLLRPGPACARPRRSRALRVRLSWGSCSHERLYVGCPVSPPRLESRFGGRGLPHPRRCRPQGSCPSRRIRPRTRHARTLADPPFAVAPRRFAALFHAARVPGTTLQSFPFPRSRTRSRGPRASLRVSFSDCRRRRAAGRFTIAFPVASALCPWPRRSGARTHEPGRQFPAVARRSPRRAFRARLGGPSLSRRHWARRLAAGTPASKLCSPRESVRRRPRALARARSLRRCSPGLLPLESLLHHGSGSGLSRRRT